MENIDSTLQSIIKSLQDYTSIENHELDVNILLESVINSEYKIYNEKSMLGVIRDIIEYTITQDILTHYRILYMIDYIRTRAVTFCYEIDNANGYFYLKIKEFHDPYSDDSEWNEIDENITNDFVQQLVILYKESKSLRQLLPPIVV